MRGVSGRRRRLPCYWVYLLVSDRGETYAGHTGCLKRRLRQHNSPTNRGWTRGRRWRLVEAKRYLDRASAVRVERALKHKSRRRASLRWRWLVRRRRRLARLCRLMGSPNPLTKRGGR